MEPIILELEREQNDLLIIAHESVLRVLYGYLMACNATDIPSLEFPRDEIIEVTAETDVQPEHVSNSLADSPSVVSQHCQKNRHSRSSPRHSTQQSRKQCGARSFKCLRQWSCKSTGSWYAANQDATEREQCKIDGLDPRRWNLNATKTASAAHGR